MGCKAQTCTCIKGTPAAGGCTKKLTCEDAPCIAQQKMCENEVQSKLSSVSECRVMYAAWANRGPVERMDECLGGLCSIPEIGACTDAQLTTMCPSSAARIGQAVAVLLAAVAIFVL